MVLLSLYIPLTLILFPAPSILTSPSLTSLLTPATDHYLPSFYSPNWSHVLVSSSRRVSMPSYWLDFFNFDVFYEKFYVLGFQNSTNLLQIFRYIFCIDDYLCLYYFIILEITHIVEYNVYIIRFGD
jgi:hypothetical protein